MNLSDQVDRLIDLAKKVKDDGLPQAALRDSIYDLSYILWRVQRLAPALKIDISSASQQELSVHSESLKALRFYSQCLILWSCRILEILEFIAHIEPPRVLKLTRHILVAHYGWADGNLRSNLKREQGFVQPPQFSPDGNFKYVIGPHGSPASTASPTEQQNIKTLFKKYCPQRQDFNWWNACYYILQQTDRPVSIEDFKKIEGFIRNNGGFITDSQSTIQCVLDSVQEYLTVNVE